MAIRYWVCALPRDRVAQSIARGRILLPGERREAIQAMGEADGIVCYSARASQGAPDRIQEFTAIGRIADAEPIRVVNAWQRRVDWDRSAAPVGLRPIAKALSSTEDVYAWGQRLREGVIEIGRGDFELLERQMRAPYPRRDRDR